MTDAAVLAERLRCQDPNGYAPWFDRRDCVELLERQGLPELRSEAWQHTNVGRWYEMVLAEQPSVARSLDIDYADDVEVVGFDDARAAELVAEVDVETFRLRDQPLAAVNGLLLGAGLVIRAPRGSEASKPVRIADLPAAFQRVVVVVEAEASVDLIEEPAAYAHRLVEAVVCRGARLRHRRHQDRTSGRECSLVAVRVEAGGRYELAQLSLGAELRRNDIVATLVGDGAEVHLRGAWRLAGRDHLDNHVTVHHAGPGGMSRQTYRGVAADRSRAVLNGRIHIATDAQHSDANLNTKNLLASDSAQVFAKPELEIYANDVKCGHGATVGAIDEEAVHYFRSRGIAGDVAKALFVRGFLREAIDDIETAERLGIVA